MDEKQHKTNAHYRFHSRLKGEVELELFNDFYLSVKERQLNRLRQYRLEIAPLDETPTRREELAVQWLAAAAISGTVGLLSLYSLFSANEIGMPLLGTFIFAGLSAAFTALYFYQSERKWVVVTRNARYPLVEIPYSKQQRQEAQAFVDTLQQAIEKNLRDKGYSNEALFAGELRMLRRLAKKNVLSETLYGRAKAYMMERHGQESAD